MLRSLVIHVGAQKCASSSLQASLRLVHQALNGRFGFCFLNPAQLRSTDLAISKQKVSAFGYVDQVLSRQTADQVVISHDYDNKAQQGNAKDREEIPATANRQRATEIEMLKLNQ